MEVHTTYQVLSNLVRVKLNIMLGRHDHQSTIHGVQSNNTPKERYFMYLINTSPRKDFKMRYNNYQMNFLIFLHTHVLVAVIANNLITIKRLLICTLYQYTRSQQASHVSLTILPLKTIQKVLERVPYQCFVNQKLSSNVQCDE